MIVPYSDYVNHYEAVSEVIKEAMNSKAAFLEELKVSGTTMITNFISFMKSFTTEKIAKPFLHG